VGYTGISPYFSEDIPGYPGTNDREMERIHVKGPDILVSLAPTFSGSRGVPSQSISIHHDGYLANANFAGDIQKCLHEKDVRGLSSQSFQKALQETTCRTAHDESERPDRQLQWISETRANLREEAVWNRMRLTRTNIVEGS
jgi:hypothetical protein